MRFGISPEGDAHAGTTHSVRYFELIDEVLLAHPAVRECVVFGVPDAPEGGEVRHERIIGCVALTTPTEVAALSAFLSGKLPAWQIPRQWWFLDELSANERGKIPRAEWRRKFLEKQGALAR